MADLKDSGNRRIFETGAVRDMDENKGRCDLLPLDIVNEMIRLHSQFPEQPIVSVTDILRGIEEYQDSSRSTYTRATALFESIYSFIPFTVWSKYENKQAKMSALLLDLAKHFQDGARKYSDNNWKRGIPTNVFMDSALRHLFKFLRGDTDEPHDRAFVWNLVCAAWTTLHLPGMDSYNAENQPSDIGDNYDR